MTTTTPSRRERLRTATVAEIKDAARRQIIANGPAGVSLRAVARDVGMTAPAIYRYFDSLDTLILDIVGDLFAELQKEVEAAAAATIPDPVDRLVDMVRAFRGWSLANPAEFALMFGSPVPGITQYAAQCGPVNDAGARFGAVYLDVLDEIFRNRPHPVLPAEFVERAVPATFGPYLATFGDRFPLPVVYAFLSSWTRLYGLVAMEVFGHLQWAVTDVEPLFELEVQRTIAQLADGR
jgi:AcrR family transcriptional regulator